MYIKNHCVRQGTECASRSVLHKVQSRGALQSTSILDLMMSTLSPHDSIKMMVIVVKVMVMVMVMIMMMVKIMITIHLGLDDVQLVGGTAADDLHSLLANLLDQRLFGRNIMINMVNLKLNIEKK